MISLKRIKKIIEISEMAKKYENYPLSAICFSLLYYEYIKGNASLTLFLEREDEEEYYQLLVIALRHNQLKNYDRPKWVITIILPDVNIGKKEKSSLPIIEEVKHGRKFSKELSKKYIFDQLMAGLEYIDRHFPNWEEQTNRVCGCNNLPVYSWDTLVETFC